MPLKIAKRIADPLHGTISLTQLESKVIEAKAFQRLRNVNHLGLAYLVYPGANFSRLSHSLGACHVAGRLLGGLVENGHKEVDDDTAQLYRIAALLHDVGHYPFSHVTELGLQAHFAVKCTEEGQPSSDGSLHHESVGRKLILDDPELSRTLKDGGIDTNHVVQILKHLPPANNTSLNLSNLISSDLDADRLDYLPRTALHTGLPYATVDIDYLVTQVRLEEKKVCFGENAVRSVEHVLLARYFDYQQVVCHRSVVGLEHVFKDVVGILLEDGKLKMDARSVSKSIEAGSWWLLDDSALFEQIKELSKKKNLAGEKARAIVHRRPPALICREDFFARPKDRGFAQLKARLEERKEAWEAELGLRGRMFVWAQEKTLTKLGSLMSIADNKKEKEKAYAQLASIARGGKLKPIVALDDSLLSILSQNSQYSVRVYALLNEDNEHLRDKAVELVKNSIQVGS